MHQAQIQAVLGIQGVHLTQLLQQGQRKIKSLLLHVQLAQSTQYFFMVRTAQMSLVKCLSRQVPMGSSPSAVGPGQLSDVLDMVGLEIAEVFKDFDGIGMLTQGE